MTKKLLRIDIQFIRAELGADLVDMEAELNLKGLVSENIIYKVTEILLDQYVNSKMIWTSNPNYRVDELKSIFGPCWEWDEFAERFDVLRGRLYDYLNTHYNHIFHNPRVWNSRRIYSTTFERVAMYIFDMGTSIKKTNVSAFSRERDPGEVASSRLDIKQRSDGTAVIRVNKVSDPCVAMPSLNVVIKLRCDPYINVRPGDMTDEQWEWEGLSDAERNVITQRRLLQQYEERHKKTLARLRERKVALGNIVARPAVSETSEHGNASQQMVSTTLVDVEVCQERDGVIQSVRTGIKRVVRETRSLF